MSQAAAGLKRKRDDNEIQHEGRKRRTRADGDNSGTKIEELGRKIAENPLKYYTNVEKLLQMIDLDDANAKENLVTAVTLCKVFSRLIASGHLDQGEDGSQQKRDLSEFCMRQYNNYKTTVVKLLRFASSSQGLPFLHLCWKIFEQDVEVWKSSVWESNSLFSSLLSALAEIPDSNEIRKTFVGEYMSQCHDCCYYSLKYFS